MNFRACVRDRVWGDLRRTIPRHDRYYLQTNYGLVHFWTFTSLLPRIAVDDPRKADWVVSYRADPKELGVPLGPVRTIRHVYTSGAYSIARREGEEVIRSLFGLLFANAAFFAAGRRSRPPLRLAAAYTSGARVHVRDRLGRRPVDADADGRARPALVAGADPLRAPCLARAREPRASGAGRREDRSAPGGSARRAARRLPRRPVRAVPVPAAELLGRVGEVDDEGARDRPPRRPGHVRLRQPRLPAARARLPDAHPGSGGDGLPLHGPSGHDGHPRPVLAPARRLPRRSVRAPARPRAAVAALAVAAPRRDGAGARGEPHLRVRGRARRLLLRARRRSPVGGTWSRASGARSGSWV